MAQMLRALVLLSALALNGPLGAQAHMEMRWPYSFRSKFNPANTDPDYDNTFPLKPDGSNFPCKGYQDLPISQDPVVTYTPGQSYNLTLAGTATHGGGSCQISLSYDDGKTFHVIKSIIGGCPLKLNWDFTIPAYAPPSNSVILAWTWFNLIGNREMYMQCARVGIAGQAVQRFRRTSSKRQASIDELPGMFTCNVGNGCQTLENHEIVFPSPGNVVETGVDAIGPSPGPGFLLNGAAPASTLFTTVSSFATPTVPVTTATTPSLVLTSTITSTITTPPFAMPNATSPGAFFSGTGTGTGRRNVTRTVTLTEFVNATSSTLTSNSSAPITTIRSAGGMFKTLTIISTLPPMPFLPGTTGTATPRVVTITQVVPLVPFGPPPVVDTTVSTSNLTTWSATTFSTIPLPTSITVTTLITSIISSTISTSSSPSLAATLNPSSVSCTPGTFTCDSATTFSQCVSRSDLTTTWVNMGSVAAGMQCIDGSIVREGSNML